MGRARSASNRPSSAPLVLTKYMPFDAVAPFKTVSRPRDRPDTQVSVPLGDAGLGPAGEQLRGAELPRAGASADGGGPVPAARRRELESIPELSRRAGCRCSERTRVAMPPDRSRLATASARGQGVVIRGSDLLPSA